MVKKITALLLAVAISISMTAVAFAAGAPTITVSSASAAPGETVTLNVSLSDNPGINTFSLGFNYDETRLSLTDVKLASGIPGQFAYSKKAVWLNSEDVTTNGNFLTLTLKVLDNAPAGEASVDVVYNAGDISNYDENDVGFQTVGGSVKVTPSGADFGEIKVGSVTGAPGETVEVPVSITKNPGINAFSLGFDYDTTRLSLKSVTKSDSIGGQFTYSKKAVWLNDKDTTYTGDILTLTFEILDNALDSDVRVNVVYNTGDISNYDEEDVYFEVAAGQVSIKSPIVYDAKVSLGKVTGNAGEKVNVYVTLDTETAVKSMSIYDVVYDEDILTLTEGKWVVTDTVIADWNDADKTGVSTFSSNTYVGGRVFLLTFTVNEGLEDGATDITCKFKLTSQDLNGSEKELKTEVIPGSVNVVNSLRGDVNGDDHVDSNDAIHLLYHTLLPDNYSINQNGDFDGDGEVDSDDAIHLLYHVTLPEKYPLA